MLAWLICTLNRVEPIPNRVQANSLRPLWGLVVFVVYSFLIVFTLFVMLVTYVPCTVVASACSCLRFALCFAVPCVRLPWVVFVCWLMLRGCIAVLCSVACVCLRFRDTLVSRQACNAAPSVSWFFSVVIPTLPPCFRGCLLIEVQKFASKYVCCFLAL